MKNLYYTIVLIAFAAFATMDLHQAITNESIPFWRRHSDVFFIKEPLFFWIEVTFRVIVLFLVCFVFKLLIFEEILKGKRNEKSNSKLIKRKGKNESNGGNIIYKYSHC